MVTQVLGRGSAPRRASAGLAMLALWGGLLASLLAARPAHAATFTVENTDDSDAGSLRQAMEDANAKRVSPPLSSTFSVKDKAVS